MMGFLRFSTSTFCTINALRLYTHWEELHILFSELSESRSRLQDNTTPTPPPPCLFVAQPTAASQKPTRRPSDDQSPGLQKEKADKSKRQTRADEASHHTPTKRVIRSTASVEHKTPPEAVTPKLNKGKKRPLGRLPATRVKRSKPRPNYVVEHLSVGEDESDFTIEDEVHIQSG
jgi:hypothetical protein